MTEATTEKLARALIIEGAPAQMVAAARAGRYDDFKSESATPIIDLVKDLQRLGLRGLALRAMNGDFDASKEESAAWFEREGKDLISCMSGSEENGHVVKQEDHLHIYNVRGFCWCGVHRDDWLRNEDMLERIGKALRFLNTNRDKEKSS